ncbi:TVP38/TMEM64 family protein [Acholeplasma granularum]|uniref:TVP38/TMEM64 family protein n=1 Tax=Acholeplasma granularum TaxID=264635 RepID=UPI00046F9578|nr:VTT domain-containing protein [Acholeplasma granularum]
MPKNYKKRILITTLILFLIIGLLLYLFLKYDLYTYINDVELIKAYILLNENLSKFIYIAINFLQTTIIPITNIPTIMAGSYIFGPFEASNLAIIGVLIGSLLSFYVGRIFGKKLFYFLIGKERLEKQLEQLNGRENVVFFLMMLLPGFPDDVLCMISGITPMRTSFFIITLLITRTIPIYLTAYGTILIPLNTVWGIIIWIAIYLLIIFIGQYILRHWDSFIDKINKKNGSNKN